MDKNGINKNGTTQNGMNRTVVTVLVFGLLLIAIFSPFSALAALMLVLFVTNLGWMSLNLVRAFIEGESEKE